MESELSAGGAAQRVVPQRACGCAAVLCFLAERSCKAPPFSSLAAGRRPFINSLTRLRRRHPPYPFVAAVLGASRPMRKEGHARIPRAMARHHETLFVVGDCFGTCAALMILTWFGRDRSRRRHLGRAGTSRTAHGGGAARQNHLASWRFFPAALRFPRLRIRE